MSHDRDAANDVMHVWEPNGPKRGRTHYSWSLLKTEALFEWLDGMPVAPGRNRQMTAPDTQLQSIVAEFPSPELCRALAAKYFETFGTVYYLLDKETFLDLLDQSLINPRSTPLCFAVRALVVFAIGNAVIPFEDAPLPRSLSMKWIELASPTTTIALETSSEFDIESIRTWTLINLARQTISSNEMADYVSAGGAVKAGMACGMHRIDTRSRLSQDSYDRLMLFNAAVDLDLNASITAGLPPTQHGSTDTLAKQYLGDDQEITSAEGTRLALYGSIGVRYRILDCLNREDSIAYSEAQALTDQLTRTMGAVALQRPWTVGEPSFLLDYATATYRRYLFALHRPFVDLGTGGQTLQSARIVAELARKQVLDNLEYWEQGRDRAAMAALFLGYGVTAHADILHAVCYLWWDVRKTEDEMSVVNRALQCVARDDSEHTLDRFCRHSAQMHWTHSDSWLIYTIARMATAHVRAVKHYPRGSEGYCSAMDREALDVKDALVRAVAEREQRY